MVHVPLRTGTDVLYPGTCYWNTPDSYVVVENLPCSFCRIHNNIAVLTWFNVLISRISTVLWIV
jgi:hypothetical protein